jgi:hypothetical protein
MGWNPAGWIMLAVGGMVELAAEYLKGMWVQRAFRDKGKIGVFVDTRGRRGDLAEYGDQIKGVSCCSY